MPGRDWLGIAFLQAEQNLARRIDLNTISVPKGTALVAGELDIRPLVFVFKGTKDNLIDLVSLNRQRAVISFTSNIQRVFRADGAAPSRLPLVRIVNVGAQPPARYLGTGTRHPPTRQGYYTKSS